MDDLFASVKEHAADRVRSPLAGAFLIAWCLWNYEIPITLFDLDMASSEKIAFIQAQLGAGWGFFWRAILAPVLVACAYVGLYPVASLPVLIWHRRMHNKRRELRQKEDGSNRLTKEESDAVQVEAARMVKAAQDALSAAQAENTRLTDEMQKSHGRASSAQQQIVTLEAEGKRKDNEIRNRDESIEQLKVENQNLRRA